MAFELIKVIYGITQMNKSKKALNRLSNWHPTYRSGESILQEATAKTPFGYSAQERAVFNNDLSRLGTQKYRMATQSNPNLAQNIQAGIDYGNIAALEQFAKSDASLKQQKIGQLASMITAQDNAKTAYDINQKSQMEQAYGEAYKAGLANVVGVFDSKMNDLKTVASFVIPMAGTGGTSSTPSTTTQTLGSLVGGKTLSRINSGAATTSAMGASAGNMVGGVPYNTYWKPEATPTYGYTPSSTKTYPSTLNDWITNPNQFRP